MNGSVLYQFIKDLNGGAAIDITLAGQLVETAKAIIEEEREWTVLRKTDTSKTVATSSLWTTAIDLSTITNFSRFYGDFPVRIFDGDNKIAHYRQVPWEERLRFKDVSNTFVFDENSGNIYLNGLVPFAGTLYINHLVFTAAIDLTSESGSNAWTPFQARFSALLGYYAIGIHKGAIDYDSINKLMLPENRFVMMALKNALSDWDNKRQLSAIDNTDPTDIYGQGHRDGAINIDD